MNDERRQFVLKGATAFGLIAGLGGCASAVLVPAPATPPPAPVVRVGDRWRYARINRYNGIRLGESTMRVTAIAPQLRIEVVGANDAAGVDEVYSEPWRVIQEPAYDQALIFEVPSPVLPSRLEPGASERYSGPYRMAGDESRRYWSVWVDARNWERVIVPAGSFDALRVTRRAAFEHPDYRRLDSVRVDTLWYAPQVNRWVRREWTGSYRVPGFPPFRNREDWIAWELIEYVQATA